MAVHLVDWLVDEMVGSTVSIKVENWAAWWVGKWVELTAESSAEWMDVVLADSSAGTTAVIGADTLGFVMVARMAALKATSLVDKKGDSVAAKMAAYSVGRKVVVLVEGTAVMWAGWWESLMVG